MDAPSLGLARHDVNTDKPLRANRLWGRPEEEFDHRGVGCLFHPKAVFRILEGEVEVRSFIGKAGHLTARGMVRLHLRYPFDRRAVNFDRLRKRLGRHGDKWKMDLHPRPSWVVIQHEE